MVKKNKKPILGSKEVEKEFDLWCKTLYAYTKAVYKNPTKANTWLYAIAYRDAWTLAKFPRHLASVKAFNDFKSMTGKDIRDCDWLSTAKNIKTGKTFQVHKEFKDEHLTTANDFKEELLYLYGKKELSVKKIKKLLLSQRLCWVTKDENDKLNKKYKNTRVDPLQAYKDCGIEIYDIANEDVSNIMKRTYI